MDRDGEIPREKDREIEKKRMKEEEPERNGRYHNTLLQSKTH